MKFCILMGSPRPEGNTAEMCRQLMERLAEKRAECEYIRLAELDIRPCLGCYACQNVSGSYGCAQRDDMEQVVQAICRADHIVLATPIFSWYCTAQMKAVLDRHYGLNKFYGSAEGSLWAGKHLSILASHGYEQEYATQPFAMGVERLCVHSGLIYDGICSVQDTDDLASFRTEEAIAAVRAYADRICAE